MSEPKYDSATCVTAWQLRRMGIPLDPEIPMESWVPWSSVDINTTDCYHDDDQFHITMSYHFREPFRWLVLDCRVEEEVVGG